MTTPAVTYTEANRPVQDGTKLSPLWLSIYLEGLEVNRPPRTRGQCKKHETESGKPDHSGTILWAEVMSRKIRYCNTADKLADMPAAEFDIMRRRYLRRVLALDDVDFSHGFLP